MTNSEDEEKTAKQNESDKTEKEENQNLALPCSPLSVIQEDAKESEKWTPLEQRKTALLTSTLEESSKENEEECNQDLGDHSVEKTKQKFLSKESSVFDFPHVKKHVSEKPKMANDNDDDVPPSTTLDLNEKSWIIRTAQADLVQMRVLLDRDESLADKKDFVMNGIHWAAKKGNLNMLSMLLDLNVNVNSKSGYTPLHLAAIHGHERCISLLLDHGADVHARDYSGKKAIDYLSPSESDVENRLPSWKQHYYSGPRLPCLVSSDLYTRIEIKIITSKLDNDVMFRNRRESEASVTSGADRKQRAKSIVLSESRGSFSDGSAKSTKISRRESTRSSWKLPGIRKQKLPSVSDQLLIEHPVMIGTHGKPPISPSS